MTGRLATGAALLALGYSATGPAFAHARLVSAIPPVGSSVPAPPASLSITFSEAVEPQFSHVVVTGPDGAEVDRADLKAAPGDAKTVTVDLKTLSPGTYKVQWHALSTDTHKTQGSYRFTVGP